MPVCFQLFKKGSGEPEKLNDVDRAMCDHFKKPCSDTMWLYGWYDLIGFGIACGKDFDYFIQGDYSNKVKAIAQWLKDNYTTDHWRGVK